MYKLEVKLTKELSRTLYVPENILFSNLDSILRTLFGFSYFHLSVFEFPGLNTVMWDYEKTIPGERAMDMNDVPIKDYLEFFTKFAWSYDLGNTYRFIIRIKKANQKYDTDYPFVESFVGEYNPIEDISPYDFGEMLECALKNMEFPDWLPDFELEKFNIDEVNQKLRG